MAQFPPGGHGPPAYDPYAADRALAGWANARGFALGTTPDIGWYMQWYPLTYAPALGRLGRELRGVVDDAAFYAVEIIDPDPIRQAAGEDRHVAFFVASNRFPYRASLRSKLGGGVLTELSSGLGSLFGGKGAGSVLGDPTLESRYDVSVPSRQEGNLALPMPLRQLLVQTGFRGVVEVRTGGLVCVPFGLSWFEPASLDHALGMVSQIYRAAAGPPLA